MAVHRVGPTSPTSKPHRQDLGRVQVTIDDLKALVDLLQASPSTRGALRVEFTGGYLDDAEDLRELNDDELTSIKIKATNVEITLDSVEATVIGPETVTQNIYKSWARTRQQPRARWTRRSLHRLNWVLLSAIGILFAFSILTFSIGGSTRSLLVLNLLGGCLILALTGMLANCFEPRRRPATVIRPFTLNEVRTAQVTNKWPRAAVIVSMASAAIAVLAIVIPVVAAR